MTPDERKVVATMRALVADLGLQLAASDRLVAELRQERDTLAAQCEALAGEVADLMDKLADKDKAVASLRKSLTDG